ncbi:MAG: hypothetical protein A2096_17505 [Spirochaetes bacterium GWF1_41_5]|nr:MAG: hypothetical protein A2096_17505 [Spirochaetes bacterium GWF1_41_5]HBE02720.1 hypothetical protein [Spirochaetia bacterium]
MKVIISALLAVVICACTAKIHNPEAERKAAMKILSLIAQEMQFKKIETYPDQLENLNSAAAAKKSLYKFRIEKADASGFLVTARADIDHDLWIDRLYIDETGIPGVLSCDLSNRSLENPAPLK